MSDRAHRREQDEADLRWFWNSAEGDLGFDGSGDFERAAQVTGARTPRCPACRVEAPSRVVDRARRAKCRACLGLGVVVPSTYPSGNAPASPSWIDPWLALLNPYRAPLISARLPPWASLDRRIGMLRAKHRAVRIALRAMDGGHVYVLHAVHGPPTRVFPEDMPAEALMLAAWNRGLPEHLAIPLRKRLGARFAPPGERIKSAAHSHARMLLSGSWRAYDLARGRVVDEEREDFVADVAAIDDVLEERPSGIRLRDLVEDECSGAIQTVEVAT